MEPQSYKGSVAILLLLLLHLCAGAFAFTGDRGFDVNVASLQRDTALLDRARTAFSKEAESYKGLRLLHFSVCPLSTHMQCACRRHW